jgi:hypothetical protein
MHDGELSESLDAGVLSTAVGANKKLQTATANEYDNREQTHETCAANLRKTRFMRIKDVTTACFTRTPLADKHATQARTRARARMHAHSREHPIARLRNCAHSVWAPFQHASPPSNTPTRSHMWVSLTASTKISVGPAIMSIPTRPNKERLASAYHSQSSTCTQLAIRSKEDPCIHSK